jgi:pyruvate dehydrogenase E2 component (dihydrolipoamide acetyltransferase)
MATKVLVPRLGEGVDEVTITKWLKQVGDSVKELEPLLEVETDKVNTEVPAPASGVVLKIEMQEGQPAKVGQLLAVIGAAGEAVISEQSSVISESAQVKSKVESQTSEPRPSTFNLQPSNRDIGFISPVVAKMATEKGINLSDVPGTGLNGRITKTMC